MKEKPFIHPFQTSEGYYIYDVSTDIILKVPEDVFDLLSGEKTEKSNGQAIKYIENLEEKGFLKENIAKKTEHPETPFLQFHLKNKMSALLLQVTQNCNLRCEYCVYSGSYTNRVHSNKRMEIGLAKSGIDYLLSHSRDSEDLYIGFYGGEPLLELELIKQCVEYILDRGSGKTVHFNLTTNGTLITNHIIEYFEKYSITIMFSLDGPSDIHDKSRKFRDDSKSSHALLLKNVQMIKENYPNYFKEHVHFNTVLNTENGFSCVSDYIKGEDLISDSMFISSLINDSYSLEKRHLNEEFLWERKYETFKLFLNKLGILRAENISNLSKSETVLLDEVRKNKQIVRRLEQPQKSHHGGPCVPGAFRMFLTVNGDIFPCERVSELSKASKIGTIEDGINLEDVERVLNIERVTEEECHKCWAYIYCDMCIAHVDDMSEISKKLILKKCDSVRMNTEDIFKDYCVLKYFGYDSDSSNFEDK